MGDWATNGDWAANGDWEGLGTELSADTALPFADSGTIP